MALSAKQKKIATALVVCVAVVIVVLLIPRGQKSGPADGGSESIVYAVRSADMDRQTLVSYIQTNGDVEATRSIDVYPDMGGKLVRTHVNLGSQVTKGQVIAEVDPSTPGVPYEISPVRAPLSGAITSQPLQPGTTVTTSTAVAVIGSIDDLQITADVPERYASLLQPGMKADVTLEAYPGVTFSATVTRVSPVVDSTSRTKELQFAFDEQDSRINAGMFAKIKLYTTAKENVLVVPETCVLSSLGKQYVFVVSDDGTKAVQRTVTTGMSVDGVLEVLSGLTDDDKIIIEGAQLLSDGSSIRDLTTISRTNTAEPSATAEAEKKTTEGDAV